jgi:hypothetical protein
MPSISSFRFISKKVMDSVLFEVLEQYQSTHTDPNPILHKLAQLQRKCTARLRAIHMLGFQVIDQDIDLVELIKSQIQGIEKDFIELN